MIMDNDYSIYTRQIIYGGLDGIITTFSIVAASVGANLDYKIVITMGFANLFADAISMGFGEYLSTSLENNLILEEREKKSIEIDENIFDFKEKLINFLVDKKNMHRDHASNIIHSYTSSNDYNKIFLDYATFLENDIQMPQVSCQLIKNGFATFISFILFGCLPLIVFISVCSMNTELYYLAFYISIGVTTLTMFFLGFFQAIISYQNPFYNGFIVMINGTIATSCAYAIGYIFENLL